MAAIGDDELARRKDILRSHYRALRGRLTDAERRASDGARTGLLMEALTGHPGIVVACYLSAGVEPDTLQIAEWAGRHGHRVLCPVLSPLADGRRRPAPAWAWYTGTPALRPGLWGIPEPTGPVLDADALAEADLVLVSALAGGRDGSRLGTGGGWFDRALRHARADAGRWALLHPGEVTDHLPQGPLDVPMTHLAGPDGIITCGRA